MESPSFFQKENLASNASRGLISGFIGGLAGTAIKSLIEQYLPVRKVEDRSAQIKILDDLSIKMTGTPISTHNEALAEQMVSFPIGASIGAAYGYGKKHKDELNVRDGVVLGSSTWISTHETSLPFLGLESNPTDIPVRMQLNELFAHVMFGVTTELVRFYVNKGLKK